MFEINSETGEMTVSGRLDREEQVSCLVTISATDAGENSIPTVAFVIVNVIDVNDNAPKITVDYMSDVTARLSVREHANNGTLVGSVSVTDDDEGGNGQVECHLSSTSDLILAPVRERQFEILTARSFYRKFERSVHVVVFCRDFGQRPMTSSLNLTVDVDDVDDDDVLQFSRGVYDAFLEENSPSGVAFVNVSIITDTVPLLSSFPIVTYSLVGSDSKYFRVDRLTGEISASRSFDREQVDRFEFNVTAATDDDEDGASFEVSALVRVHIVDVDDEWPKFDRLSSYEFEAYEDAAVGTEVGRVTAVDRDLFPFNETRYSFESSSDGDDFDVHGATGAVFTRRRLDRETQGLYSLEALAHGQTTGPMTTTDSVHVLVRILDRNDNRPVITYPSKSNDTLMISASDVFVGSVVGSVAAYDRDEGVNALLRYRSSGQSEFFSVVFETGQIFLKGIPPEDTTYLVEVTVWDEGVPSLNSSGTLRIVVVDAGVLTADSVSTQALLMGDLLGFAGIVVGCAVFVAAVIVVVSVCVWQRFIRGQRRKGARNNEVVWNVVRSTGSSGESLDPTLTEAAPDKEQNSKKPNTFPKLDFFEQMNSEVNGSICNIITQLMAYFRLMTDSAANNGMNSILSYPVLQQHHQ